MKWPAKNTRWVVFSSMGMELGLSVVVGFLIGSWLDGWLGTDPWLLLVFGAAGIIAGYRSIFRLLKKVQTKQQEEESQHHYQSTRTAKLDLRDLSPTI